MTIFVGDRAAASFPVAQGHTGGAVHVAYGVYEVTTNPVDGDTYELCKVPAGAVIFDGMFFGDDLDTNTGSETLDLDVGWKANGGSGTYDSADPNGLADMGTLIGSVAAPNLAQVASGLVYNFAGPIFGAGDFPTFTAETTIQVEANTAASTFASGAIGVYVLYTTP
jgi:hypothetical protein